MLILYSLLLILFWLIVPTMLSALCRPPKAIGREGFAALMAIAFWLVLAYFRLPVTVLPHLAAGESVLFLLAISIAAYVYIFVGALQRPPKGYQPSRFGGDFLALAVLSPLDEELLFRGLLFALALPALGPFLTVLYSAALFALSHEAGALGGMRRSLAERLSDLAFGIVVGCLYAVTGTILAPVLAHMLVNGVHAYTRPAGSLA